MKHEERVRSEEELGNRLHPGFHHLSLRLIFGETPMFYFMNKYI